MKIPGSKVDCTPVNIAVANMCLGVTVRYSIEELYNELQKWWECAQRFQKGLDFIPESKIRQRALKSYQARIRALAVVIAEHQIEIETGAFK